MLPLPATYPPHPLGVFDPLHPYNPHKHWGWLRFDPLQTPYKSAYGPLTMQDRGRLEQGSGLLIPRYDFQEAWKMDGPPLHEPKNERTASSPRPYLQKRRRGSRKSRVVHGFSLRNQLLQKPLPSPSAAGGEAKREAAPRGGSTPRGG